MSDTYLIPDRATAHRKATELFSEDFFWDITDDNSPFGNDDGADTLAELNRFLQAGGDDLTVFLDDLFAGWGAPNKNLNLTTTDEIKESMERGDDEIFITMRDNAIVATAFGQYLIQGTITNDIKELALQAIKRRALPMFSENWTDPEERMNRLKLMDEKLHAMK